MRPAPTSLRKARGMPPSPNAWEDDEETIVSDLSRARRTEEDAASTLSGAAARPVENDRPVASRAGPVPGPGLDEDELSTIADRSEDEAGTILAGPRGSVTPGAPLPAWLVVTVSTRPSERHRLIQLQALRTVIGRDAGRAHVLVDDPAVSRQHAAIRFSQQPDGGNGEFTLYDLASTHGTFLNGERVAAPRNLCDGDRIRVGATELAFKRL